MVKSASLFSQVLSLFPRLEFEQAVRQHQAERYAKGLSCWQQFVAMLFCQLAQAHSLREICGGLRCCLGRLVHLGVRAAPKRSSLAYANEHRPWQLYQEVFYQLLDKCRGLSPGPGHKLRFRNPLLSLDSTVVELCLSLFPWADFTRTKGAVKLHCLLDHQGYLPTFALVTVANVSDVAVARMLTFARGSVVVFDRAYKDYALWARWSADGVFFVSRMVRGTIYEVVERRPVPQHRHILTDEIIRLSSQQAVKQGCTCLLRRVVLWLPDKAAQLELITNHLDFGATTIAGIYKQRWQIELFFRALKQNLRIKSFVGTTPNALQVQIWTALIALLLLKYLKLRARFGWSLSNLVALLHWNLFTYRDLWGWLDDPFHTPPQEPPAVQLSLALGQHLA
jgi:transposase